VRLRGTDRGTVVAARVMALCMDHNAVVGVLVTPLYVGCNAVLVVPGTQLENAAEVVGVAPPVRASVLEYGSHVWQELVRLLG
jgi:hypothetical protein